MLRQEERHALQGLGRAAVHVRGPDQGLNHVGEELGVQPARRGLHRRGGLWLGEEVRLVQPSPLPDAEVLRKDEPVEGELYGSSRQPRVGDEAVFQEAEEAFGEVEI